MENILVPIDFSETTVELIDKAASLARVWESKLWLIHVVAPHPVVVGHDQDPQPVRKAKAARLQKNRQQLQREASELRRQGLDTTALVVQGYTVKSIVSQARRIPADMIVLGSHRDSAVYRYLLGSVTEGVLQEAHCPLLIVPSRKKRFTASEKI